MSAELLREAAALIKKRAKAATPEPWELQGGNEWLYPFGIDVGSEDEGAPLRAADAEHIISWRPTVALTAVALLEVIEEDVGTSSLAYKAAEAFARAYLGRDS